MVYSRRDFGKVALASVPMAAALGATINSKIDGVQIGAITYSFNTIANEPESLIKAYVEIGLGEVELMSNHCEALAGIPQMPRGGGFAGGPGRGARAPLTPEQQAARDEAAKKIADWRAATGPATWKAVRKKWNDAGVDVALLTYNMQDSMKDSDIEYGFAMAKGLGVKGMTTSTTLTMAKRIAPIADSHKLLVGYHGHDQTSDPNQTATLESYDALMGYGKFNGINLDVGHFTASNYDAVAFIEKHNDKITNLHIKDRKKDHGPNVPWGEGDTPLKAVLQLLRKNKYKFPANIELEYRIPEGSNAVAEVKKCLLYTRNCLA